MAAQWVDVSGWTVSGWTVSGWTTEQWLAACILAFIVISIGVVMYRMLKLFRWMRKPSYRPNLRPLRRTRPGSGSGRPRN